VSLDRLVEEIIREAAARGKFDNLPGKGKPLDLDAYFAMPEEQRAAFQILKDAGFVPEEVQLLKDIAALKEQLAGAGEADQARIKKAIDEKTLGFNIMMDRKRIRRKR
jgi:uncharacterized protein YutE (UPF0331/DUF86 family)